MWRMVIPYIFSSILLVMGDCSLEDKCSAKFLLLVMKGVDRMTRCSFLQLNFIKYTAI